MLSKFREGQYQQPMDLKMNGNASIPDMGGGGHVAMADAMNWQGMDMSGNGMYAGSAAGGSDFSSMYGFGLDEEYFPPGMYDAINSHLPG